MKKVFLTLILGTVLVSCKNVDAPSALTKENSVTVEVDSVQVDSTEEAAIIEAEKVQDSIDAATTK